MVEAHYSKSPGLVQPNEKQQLPIISLFMHAKSSYVFMLKPSDWRRSFVIVKKRWSIRYVLFQPQIPAWHINSISVYVRWHVQMMGTDSVYCRFRGLMETLTYLQVLQ